MSGNFLTKNGIFILSTNTADINILLPRVTITVRVLDKHPIINLFG